MAQMRLFMTLKPSRWIVAVLTAMAIMLGLTTASLADTVVADGDGAAPISSKTLNFGTVCPDEAKTLPARIGLRRQGSPESLLTFANSQNQILSIQEGVPEPLVVTLVDGRTATPANWTTRPAGRVATNTAAVNVTFTGTTPGVFEYQIGLALTGRNILGDPLIVTTTQVVKVTVESCGDTTPPTLTVPANQELVATSPEGALYSFTPTATDEDPTNPAVSCTSAVALGEGPTFSATFPIGETAVTCTATDAAENTATAAFTVTVADSTAPAAIRSSVVDGTGAPVADVSVGLFQADEAGRGPWIRDVSSAPDGTLLFGDLTPGCYIITFVAPAGQQFTNGAPFLSSATTCVAAGEEATVPPATLVSLSTLGSVSGTVRQDGTISGGVEGVSLGIFEANGDGSRGAWLRDTVTAADGTYRFDGLTPACHVITFVAPPGQLFTNGSQYFSTGPLCVAAGEEIPEIDATLAAIPS